MILELTKPGLELEYHDKRNRCLEARVIDIEINVDEARVCIVYHLETEEGNHIFVDGETFMQI